MSAPISPGHESVRLVRAGNERAQVVHPSSLVGVLQQHREGAGIEGHLFGRRHPQFNPQWNGAAAQDRNRLWIAAIRHEKDAAILPEFLRTDAVQKRHGFAGGRSLIQQRCIGDVHRGQIGDHRLEVQKRLEPALRNLRLVRRVRRIPPWIFEQVALDHAGRERVVVAQPDETAQHLVLARDRLETREVLRFCFGRREVERRTQANACRNRFVDEGVERCDADGVEHRFRVFR
jgi:hypothetical protein